MNNKTDILILLTPRAGLCQRPQSPVLSVHQNTGKLKKQWSCVCGPQPAQKYHRIWAKRRKFNMGQKQKIHAKANSELTSAPNDVGRPLAAPHHMVAAACSGRHHVVIHRVAR